MNFVNENQRPGLRLEKLADWPLESLYPLVQGFRDMINHVPYPNFFAFEYEQGRHVMCEFQEKWGSEGAQVLLRHALDIISRKERERLVRHYLTPIGESVYNRQQREIPKAAGQLYSRYRRKE